MGDCVIVALAKNEFINGDICFRVLCVLDDMSLMFINHDVKSIVCEMFVRGGLLKRLCLERLYEELGDKENMSADTIKGREIISRCEIETFRTKKRI